MSVQKITDVVSGSLTYVGEAKPGTATTEIGWSIKKISVDSGETTEAWPVWERGVPTSKSKFKWSERESLNYSLTPDTVPPTLTTVTIASDNSDTTKATTGDEITITIVSDEYIQNVTATIAGHAATITEGVDDLHFTATYTMVSGDTEGTIPFTINFEDIAGHVGTEVTAVTGGSGVTFDKTRPTASIAYDTALAVKSGATLLITATFSEPLLDSPIVKIAITGGNTLVATNMTKVDADTYTYSHTVGAGNGTATVALSIGTDGTGNVIVAAPTSGATFVVDNTVPVFTGVSVLSNNADPDVAKSGDIVTAIFTTSEPLTANPTVTLGAQAMTFATLVGSTYTYTRTLNGTETEGDCNALVTGTDIAGNTTTDTNIGDVQTDFTAPVGSTVTMASNNTNTALAKEGDVITLTIVTDTDVENLVATLDGNAMTIVPGVDDQHWTATYTMQAGDTEGALAFTLDFDDLVGNAATQITAVTGGSPVTYDETPPTLDSAVRTNDTTFVVTLSELALDTTTTAANDGGFIAHETGTPGTTYAVTGIAPGATDDEVTLTVANAGASSAAGLTIKYASTGNGNVTDLAGNEMATDETGVVVAPW